MLEGDDGPGKGHAAERKGEEAGRALCRRGERGLLAECLSACSFNKNLMRSNAIRLVAHHWLSPAGVSADARRNEPARRISSFLHCEAPAAQLAHFPNTACQNVTTRPARSLYPAGRTLRSCTSMTRSPAFLNLRGLSTVANRRRRSPNSAGNGPARSSMYPNSAGMRMRRLPPSRMPSTPCSKPGISRPAPSVNTTSGASSRWMGQPYRSASRPVHRRYSVAPGAAARPAPSRKSRISTGRHPSAPAGHGSRVYPPSAASSACAGSGADASANKRSATRRGSTGLPLPETCMRAARERRGGVRGAGAVGTKAGRCMFDAGAAPRVAAERPRKCSRPLPGRAGW